MREAGCPGTHPDRFSDPFSLVPPPPSLQAVRCTDQHAARRKDSQTSLLLLLYFLSFPPLIRPGSHPAPSLQPDSVAPPQGQRAGGRGGRGFCRQSRQRALRQPGTPLSAARQQAKRRFWGGRGEIRTPHQAEPPSPPAPGPRLHQPVPALPPSRCFPSLRNVSAPAEEESFASAASCFREKGLLAA